MARRRMIEVSIAHDKVLNSLSEFAQLLYFKMLPHTDDFGRFDGDPEGVQKRADPYGRRKLTAYEKAMLEIANAGLWMWYETEEGRKVVQYNKDAFERINAFLIKKRGNPEWPAYKDSYKLLSTDIQGISHIKYKDKAESIKQEAESKKTYGEFENVFLTDREYSKLTEKLGDGNRVKIAIEILSAYKKSKNKRYDSDYATFHTWVIKELEQRERNGNNTKGNGSGFKKSGAGGATTAEDLSRTHEGAVKLLELQRAREQKNR